MRRTQAISLPTWWWRCEAESILNNHFSIRFRPFSFQIQQSFAVLSRFYWHAAITLKFSCRSFALANVNPSKSKTGPSCYLQVLTILMSPRSMSPMEWSLMLTSQPCFHVHLANRVTVNAKISHHSGLSHHLGRYRELILSVSPIV